MRYARIEDGVIQEILLARGEEELIALSELGVFPDHALFVPCPEGYSLGDLYEEGTFRKADGTEPSVFPEPAPVPTLEDDLMAMAIDHEYRLTLLELGVME